MFRTANIDSMMVFSFNQQIVPQSQGVLVDALKEAIKTAPEVGVKTVVVDLAGQGQIDDTFFRQAMPVIKDLKEMGIAFYLVNVPREVKKLLIDYGMNVAIKIAPSIRSLRSSLGAPKPNKKDAVLDVDFINVFIDAALKTLKIQCSFEVQAGKPYLKKESLSEPLAIAAIIGLTSPSFTGSIALGFPSQVFLRIMSNMLMEEFTEIDDELQDGAGELLNIIFGQAKAALNERGYGLDLAIPSVIRGNDLKVTHMTNSPAIIIPFTSEVGPLYIEVGIDRA
ncbi:MAG: chemotaxis protein CheX [Pseudobdellovibrionaceae bacterium]|nr:chemotaxis protein CheX [Bdellovibrionales bacterium]USN48317.1 MAG: chemotaxis protein CheX [Pseudobdellovibrionaceae bacterium]